jgi:hypothetical protein
MIRKLRGRWVKAFCADPLPSPDRAARCLEGGEKRSTARAALAAMFGGDTDLLIDDVTRARANEARPAAPKDAKTKPPAPDIEEVPSSSSSAGAEAI